MKKAEDYLKALEGKELIALTQLRDLMRKHAPDAVEIVKEMGGKEMIIYERKDGKFIAAMGTGKNYMSFHFLPLYCFADFAAKYKAQLKGVKMGKACLNFTDIDKLPMKVVDKMIIDGIAMADKL